jgi:hypothetical protein
MLPAVVTITASSGPGIEATALQLTGVTNIQFDYVAGTVSIFQGSKFNNFSLEGVTAVTCTISGGVATWVIS